MAGCTDATCLPAEPCCVLQGPCALGRRSQTQYTCRWIRQADTRLVEDIKRVQTNPHSKAFGNRHRLVQTEVRAAEPWAWHRLIPPGMQAGIEVDQLVRSVLQRYENVIGF